MQFDLCTPLTLKFMGLGRSYREAERITGLIMAILVMVLTLMGCRICDTGSDEPEIQIRRLTIIPGIYTGITGSKELWVSNSVVDARQSRRSC